MNLPEGFRDTSDTPDWCDFGAVELVKDGVVEIVDMTLDEGWDGENEYPCPELSNGKSFHDYDGWRKL